MLIIHPLLGGIRMPNNEKIGEEDIKKILELYYYRRLSLKQIADVFNVCRNTIKNNLKKRGMKIRSKSEANLGKIRSNKAKLNYSNSKKKEKNPMWKGENVGYLALHNWIRRAKPKPILCECCKENRPYDLANISGGYKRDINDFEWLCRSCHMKKDGRINNLKQFNGDQN